ncbi:MAG: CidA/LrgA family protein [Hyphomicrobiales bacterium]|nr:CidA/LrgA family protein [Hyphomicrobiales bacterium]
MLHAILILLGCQLVGEVLARGLALPVPGPVIGMALLFAALQGRARLRTKAVDMGTLPLGAAAAFLLANLSLLFVPAGTGIIRQTAVLTAHGPGLIIALVGSTALTLIVTALVFVAVARRTDSKPETERKS